MKLFSQGYDYFKTVVHWSRISITARLSKHYPLPYPGVELKLIVTSFSLICFGFANVMIFTLLFNYFYIRYILFLCNTFQANSFLMTKNSLLTNFRLVFLKLILGAQIINTSIKRVASAVNMNCHFYADFRL